jgi:DNA-binding CsgD family transcriptional regulator
MTLDTAAEYALVLTITPHQEAVQAPPELARLSAREQELITLVARGSTDAQIAAKLYISVSTVRSHLDRIRDKTSCRRHADLTRLALQAGLVRPPSPGPGAPTAAGEPAQAASHRIPHQDIGGLGVAALVIRVRSRETHVAASTTR